MHTAMISNLLLFFIAILFIAIGCCIVILIRNELIYNYRQKALFQISQNAKKRIEGYKYDWKKYYDWYESQGSYNEMLYDLKRWKFKDFYNFEELDDPKINLLHQNTKSIN